MKQRFEEDKQYNKRENRLEGGGDERGRLLEGSTRSPKTEREVSRHKQARIHKDARPTSLKSSTFLLPPISPFNFHLSTQKAMSAADGQPQVHAFQAEISQLLDLIISEFLSCVYPP